jgi:tetratricopeptide (TPR) repeat protein
MRLAALLLSTILCLGAAAQQPRDVEGAKRTIAAIQELLKQRPDDATLYFWLGRSHAEMGDAKAAVAALEKTLELGDGYLPTQDLFAPVWDEAAFKSVYARMAARLPRLDFAPTAFELQDRTLIPEGIAYDAPSHSFFVGSVAHGKVVRIDRDRAVSDFAGEDARLDHVLGIAVDAPRRMLYVVSTSALTEKGEQSRRNAIVAFEIDTKKLAGRYEVPDARQLNDVAVAPGGRVFTSDSASGAIYEIAVKGPGPTRELVPPDRIRGSNGLAASPDAARLYVAHSTGIAVVDISTKEVKRVANETRESVAAIDGLYAWQGELIGVQNLTNPGRVIVMSLGKNGESITRVRTLLSHHHNALYEPTTGAIGEDAFYLLAATGVTHFDRQGRIDRPDSVPAPTVLRIPLPR